MKNCGKLQFTHDESWFLRHPGQDCSPSYKDHKAEGKEILPAHLPKVFLLLSSESGGAPCDRM